MTAVPPVSSPDDDDRLEVTESEIPVTEIYRWLGRPDCGAIVVFSGTARDHAPGRADVTSLAYEAYTEQVVPALERVAAEIRGRWPEVRRIAMVHRVGEVPIGGEAVVVGASSPHRDEAFRAARFGIDRLKASVPIWKRERWNGGEDWGLDAQHVEGASATDRPVPVTAEEHR
jgi:molybdopterin synthase catalytic subunit